MSKVGEKISNSSHSSMITPDRLSFESELKFLLHLIVTTSTLSAMVGFIVYWSINF